MAVSVQIRFNIDPGAVNYGKIQVDVTTEGDGNTTHSIGITDPAGGVVKLFPASPPDTIGVNASFSYDIPVDIAGDFLEGDYAFRFVVDENGTGDVELDETRTFCFEKPVWADSDLDVSVIDDCYAKVIAVIDNTAHPTGTLTRLITVQHPVIANTDSVSDTTSSESELQVSLTRSDGIAYWNVVYPVLVQASVETSDTSVSVYDFGIIAAYNDYAENRKVICNNDPCSVIACADDYLSNLNTKACARGGLARLNQKDQDTFVQLGNYMSMYNFALQCKDAANITKYYNLIKGLLSGCNCLEPTGPQVIGNTGIVYLAGQSAYDLWLAEGNAGSLEDFLATLFPVGEWVDVPEAVYAASFEKDSSDPLQYRVTHTHLEFKGTLKPADGAVYTSPVQLFSESFDPVDVLTDGLHVPVVNSINGQQVGGVKKQSSDSTWVLVFGSDYDDSQVQYLQGQIPIDGLVVTAGGLVVSPTDWVEFTDSDLENGYTVDTGSPLQWRTDGRYVYLRGQFDGSSWTSSGLKLIDASYFDGFGITLDEDYFTPVYAADNSDGFVAGQARTEADGVYVSFEGGFSSDEMAVYAVIPIAV